MGKPRLRALTALTAVVLLCVVWLGVRLLPIAVWLGAVVGAARAVADQSAAGLRLLAYGSGVLALAGCLGVTLEVSAR